MIPLISHDSYKRSHKTQASNSTSDINTKSHQQTPHFLRVPKRSKSNDTTILFIRSTPYIRGNWCGHVFVEIDNMTPMAQLLQKAASIKIQSLRKLFG